MSRLNLALAGGAPGVTGTNLTWVVVVAVIALLALAVAAVLVRQVLAASQGTEKMQEIALSIQEGAAAYLRRQFRTLSVFVVLIFFVLLPLPAATESVRWGRSGFFLVGAFFSALTGFTGMSLAVRGNVRVAAAARLGEERECRGPVAVVLPPLSAPGRHLSGSFAFLPAVTTTATPCSAAYDQRCRV